MADNSASTSASGRQFTRQEIESRNRREDALLVIDNVVYDVTEFMEEHPGGPEVLLFNAGGDASQCFHDVGHSEDAKRWMQQFVAGEVTAEDRRPVRAYAPPSVATDESVSLGAMLAAAAPPLLLVLLAWWLNSYLF